MFSGRVACPFLILTNLWVPILALFAKGGFDTTGTAQIRLRCHTASISAHECQGTALAVPQDTK
jgi:hypothetical protein